MSYTPHFSETEQTPAQRWDSTRWAICAGASDSRVPSSEAGQLMLRYVAGEIDLAQAQDEMLRWYAPQVAPSADVRPLPPAQPGQVYPYAAEMAALLHELAQLPPPQPYIDITNLLPQVEKRT